MSEASLQRSRRQGPTALGLALGINLALVGCVEPARTVLEPMESRVAVFEAPASVTDTRDGPCVQGQVRDVRGDEPIPALLVLHSPDTSAPERLSDEHGRFAFRGLAPGTYTLEVMAGGAHLRHTLELDELCLELRISLDAQVRVEGEPTTAPRRLHQVTEPEIPFRVW